MLNHTAGVSLQTAHCAADVSVYLDNFLHGGRLKEGRGNALFDAEDNTVRCRHLNKELDHTLAALGREKYAYCGGAKLDGF